MKFLNKIGVQRLWNAITARTGDLAALTTTAKSDLVAALNEVKAAANAPFRVKNWAATFDITVPSCTVDTPNGDLPKLVFKIEGQEAVDYQIVGLMGYEIFDATSGGNRINYMPVCQFTGQGQTELSVRGVIAGSEAKNARRINGWVLLKHR